MRGPEKRNFARRLRKNMTTAEVVLWTRLRGEALGYRFRRQTPVGSFVIDFACLAVKLAIEVDGATHYSPEQVDYDLRRTRYLEREGWRVLRFTNREVVENTQGVIETIETAARELEAWWARKPESP